MRKVSINLNASEEGHQLVLPIFSYHSHLDHLCGDNNISYVNGQGRFLDKEGGDSVESLGFLEITSVIYIWRRTKYVHPFNLLLGIKLITHSFLIKMLSSALSLVTFVGLSSALAIKASEDVGYYYMPIEFDIGADNRATAQLMFGSNDTEPITIVMDTGSADFWVRPLNSSSP